MRTSLVEIVQIEQFLQNEGDLGERMLLEARMLVDERFASKVNFQEYAYKAIQQYGRNILREEIKRMDQKLFNEPTQLNFQQKIKSYFKKDKGC
ncbi:hypothetical protein GCM10011506_21990 [Marivirga lumbricoides]|uniref:Uncharacterized protein n=1 Tax=Marivirga lumbricoides TaxID=1046115 RepID=A0ABQ1MAT9_9BACT|nr:hypothetical protein GCM10011506_21990 [Marivirga lumbricoides]